MVYYHKRISSNTIFSKEQKHAQANQQQEELYLIVHQDLLNIVSRTVLDLNIDLTDVFANYAQSR